MSTLTGEAVREAVLRVLEHDRWNSNLPDEHIAEKIAAILAQGSDTGEEE